MAARLRESAGNLADAADGLRRLAEIDRKNRSEYLTGVARLESRLGRDGRGPQGRQRPAGLGAGQSRELRVLRRSCASRSGDRRRGSTPSDAPCGSIPTIPRSSSRWPRPSPRCTAPTRRSRCTGGPSTRRRDLDDKLGTVGKLTELYLQRNQFDRLLTRLQHQEREPPGAGAGQAQQRDVAICLAQAYASSGDMGTARGELEPLLAANTRDTQLLHQLSKLAEEEGDFEGAARYQKQLNEIAPTDDGAARLGQLTRAMATGGSPGGLVEDGHGQGGGGPSHLPGDRQPAGPPEADSGVGDHRDDDPQGPARLGGPLPAGRGPGGVGKPEAAERAFRALLDLTLADDEKSAIVKARSRDPKLQGDRRPANPRSTGRRRSRWRTGIGQIYRDPHGLRAR